MPRLAAKLTRDSYIGPYRQFSAAIDRRMEFAALEATDIASKKALQDLRQAMQAAGLGRLGNGLGAKSDLSTGRGVFRREGGAWSASGMVLSLRSKSSRTAGAIEAYTEGADIRPKRGRWLWIATYQIPNKAGRERMTPEAYKKNGFEQKIGPLVFAKSSTGNPLLIVENVGVSLTGAARSARSLRKSGKARKGQVRKEMIIAFIAIPRTARAARINVQTIMQAAQADLPRLFREAIARTVSK